MKLRIPILYKGPDIAKLLILLAAVMVIIFGLKYTAPVFASILFALTLTVLLSPILQVLIKRRVPKGLAVAIVCLGILVVFIVLITFLSTSINQLVAKLPDYQVRLQDNLGPIINLLQRYGINYQSIIPSDWLSGASIAKTTVNLAGIFIQNTYGFIFFLVTLILMIAESDNVIRKFNAHFSPDHPLHQQLVNLSGNIQSQYKIQTLSNLLSATAITIAYVFFRIDFAILWGVLVFVLAFIPNLGIIIASIPPVLLAFVLHGATTALIVAGIVILLNAFMDNVVTPRFMGAGLHVPPVVVFISFIFWSWIFGLLGAFLALPATLIIRGLLKENKNTRFIADILSSERTDKKK